MLTYELSLFYDMLCRDSNHRGYRDYNRSNDPQGPSDAWPVVGGAAAGNTGGEEGWGGDAPGRDGNSGAERWQKHAQTMSGRGGAGGGSGGGGYHQQRHGHNQRCRCVLVLCLVGIMKCCSLRKRAGSKGVILVR